MRCPILLAVLLVFTTNALAAEPPSEEAKAHIRKATAAYNLGKYAEAAQEYETAYVQTLDANMLFNIGQSYRMAGDREKALTAYRSFIRSAPESEQRSLAEAKIRELQQQRGSGTPTPPVPAVPLDQQTDPGRSNAGSASRPENVLVSAPVPASPEPASASPFYKHWLFWTAVGAAVAGGVVLAIVLSRPGDDLRMPPTDFGTKEY